MTNPEQTIQTLARLDRDYPAFIATLPLDVSNIDLPEGLADEVVCLLQSEEPELSGWITTQPPTTPIEKFSIDPLAAAGTLAAILFLLRSHIKIEGKYIYFEHKPINNKLLEKVLDTLKGILNRSTKE